MSEEIAEQTTENAAEAPKTPEVEEKTQQDLSPEELRSALSDARKDAASQRTRRKDVEGRFTELEKKLEGMKSAEDVESIINEFKAESARKERTLMAENVALAAGLPESLAGRLAGETREELEADAKALAELFGGGAPASGSTGGTGGLNPADDAGADFDPVEMAARYGRRNR